MTPSMDIDRLMAKLNSAIAWLLVSPLHPVLSRGLMLITVTGRHSGRRYTIPVGYQRQGEIFTVLVSKARRKSWWRNYLSPGPIELRVRGHVVQGEARVVAADSEEFREALDATFRRLPFLSRQFGVTYDRRRGLAKEQWRKAAIDAAVVKISLLSPNSSGEGSLPKHRRERT